MTQSYDKRPYTNGNKQSNNTETPTKIRLHNDWGTSWYD